MTNVLRHALALWLVAGVVAGIAFVALELPVPGRAGCDVLVAAALTSPRHTVKGSWDCMSAEQQSEGALAGYSGEDGLQQLAIDRGYLHARYIGPTTGGFIYEFTGGPPAVPVTVLLFVKNGLVVRVDQDQAP